MITTINVGLGKSIQLLQNINSSINLADSLNSNQPDASNGLYILIDEIIKDLVTIKKEIRKQENHIKIVVNSWLEQYNYDWSGLSDDDYVLTDDTYGMSDVVRATYGLKDGIGTMIRNTDTEYTNVNTYPAIYVNNSKNYTETAVFGILAVAYTLIRSIKNGEHDGVNDISYASAEIIYQNNHNNVIDIRNCLLTLTNINSSNNSADLTNSYQPDASNGLYVLIKEMIFDLLYLRRIIITHEKNIRDAIDKKTMSQHYNISYLDINEILNDIAIPTKVHSGDGEQVQEVIILGRGGIGEGRIMIDNLTTSPGIYQKNSRYYSEPVVFEILAEASTIIRTLKNSDYTTPNNEDLIDFTNAPITTSTFFGNLKIAYDFRRDQSTVSDANIFYDKYGGDTYVHIPETVSSYDFIENVHWEVDEISGLEITAEAANINGVQIFIENLQLSTYYNFRSLSVEVYVRTGIYTQGWHNIFTFGLDTPEVWVALDYQWPNPAHNAYNNHRHFRWGVGGNRLTGNNILVDADTLYHIVVTCNENGDLKLVINNNSHSLNFPGMALDEDLFTHVSAKYALGNELNGEQASGQAQKHHVGNIRYMRIWSYELSDEEIEDCYNNRDDTNNLN